MRFIKILETTEFVSSSRKTPQFKSFATKFRNDMKKLLAKLGATDPKFTTGHFYISGFFTAKNGQIWYLSLSDVRFFKLHPMLLRTAEYYHDYGGGSNGYINLNVHFEKNFERIIQ